MKFILESILWIWQIPQNIAGFVLSLFKSKKEKFNTSTIYFLPWKSRFGVSLGNYIILTDNGFERDLDYVKKHEYGHSLQSRILGPLYLIIVGLPSLILNRISYYKYKKNSWGSINPSEWYYEKFPEKWANDLYQRKYGDMTLPF